MVSALRKLALFAILVALLPAALPVTDSFAGEEEEFLIVNQPKTLYFKYAIGNITVGNPRITNFKANRSKKRITLLPSSPGKTLLLIYDTKGKQRDSYSITVYPTDPGDLLAEIQQLLVDIEGIAIRQMGSKVIIDGEVFLNEDKQRIRQVIGGNSNIVDLTRFSPDRDRIVAKTIEKEIGLDEVSVRALKGKFILEGNVYSEEGRTKAASIASLYGGRDKVINAIELREVPRPPGKANTIQVTAHFVEVNKNFTKNFNFRWNPIPRVGASFQLAFDPLTSSNNTSGAITGSLDDLLPKLNYFKSLGAVRVLENPTVSVKSGGSAVIQSGTRIGFPIVSENGTPSVEFQNVGVTLEIRPYAQGNDVDMTISMDISALGTPDIQGTISIEQSKIQTEQFVRAGESVVVGGLLRTSTRKILDRPPAPSQAGVGAAAGGEGAPTASDPFPLGSLFTIFKSKDYAKQRSQFMVFITPTILKSAKDANREIKDLFNLYEVYPSDHEEASGGRLYPWEGP